MAGSSRLQDPLINRRIKVGVFNVPITVANPQTGAAVTVDALVDTGATLTVLPGSLLRQIGIQSIRQQVFELADGRTVQWPIGNAEVTVEGLSTPTLCVFGQEDVSATLGVVVLESVGLTIDPVHLRLVPTPGLLL
ncbi:MAG: retroviral-like aspartic protease family protein [Chloroflexi bacterium]|nr:retroviral-like aspartic protease family protein [Chloroflexota bacterium]